jgi:hypothetical protein
MLYLIIYADGRLRQVEQLTDELLEAWRAERVEIIQVPASSGSVLTELAAVQGDVLEWEAVRKGGNNGR